jgi:hypothetical protein
MQYKFEASVQGEEKSKKTQILKYSVRKGMK